jgi:hypothetical protein
MDSKNLIERKSYLRFLPIVSLIDHLQDGFLVIFHGLFDIVANDFRF